MIQKQATVAKAAVQSSSYPHSKPVQTSLTSCTTTTSKLEKTNDELVTLRLAVKAKEDELAQDTAAYQSAATAYAYQVEIAANNDAAVVRSLGLDVKGESPNKKLFGPPAKVTVKRGVPDGTAELHWSRGRNARSYEIETAPDASGPWTHATVVSRARVTLTGLPSGKKVWVRVASVGAAGVSDWTTPVAVSVA